MKKRRTVFFLIAAVLIAGALLSGCELLDFLLTDYDYQFRNYSSYDITVMPDNGQTWDSFLLYSGSSHTVSISDDTIYFLYNYASYVYPDTSSSGSITFYDRY